MEPVGLEQAYRGHLQTLERGTAHALEESRFDTLVIHSGSPLPRTPFDDQFWPLRPTPHFQHWLPLAAADSALVIAPGKRPRLVWLRERSNFWERPPAPESEQWRGFFDVIEVEHREELPTHLPGGARTAWVGDAARASAPAGAAVNPPRLVERLDQLRVRKTAYEVACLDEANRRAAVGHARVAAAFRAGDSSELELHLLYLAATGQDDPETPYKNIVAQGENAATLHHIGYTRRASSAASSLLVDAGATYLGYCSDITRTYVKGAPNSAGADAFGALVARVEAMQQRLCGEVKVGLPYERLHERAHALVGAILVELGVARMSAEEAVASGVTRAFFPHGLGHSLGLQCHDVGCATIAPKKENPFLRNTTVIAPDQVFTIEPGVYFIDSLLAPLRAARPEINWALVDELARFGGVRIEDDLHVLGEGVRNLTRAHVQS
jgi:Xaa-Pro dipeptidase